MCTAFSRLSPMAKLYSAPLPWLIISCFLIREKILVHSADLLTIDQQTAYVYLIPIDRFIHVFEKHLLSIN